MAPRDRAPTSPHTVLGLRWGGQLVLLAVAILLLAVLVALAIYNLAGGA